MNHITIGVYPNGDYKVNIVKPEHLLNHITYNENFRPGRLFFIDGKYAFGGIMNKEKLDSMIIEWEEKISKMTFDISVSSELYE